MVIKWTNGITHSSTANKYSSTGHPEQKNKKSSGQIKFSVVTLKKQIKVVLTTSAM